jgi:Chlamydia polymorphic membrane protein (Chlamydia_PMP) repeat
VLGGLAVATVASFAASSSALAVTPTPVTCPGLQTAVNGATAGEVLQLPSGTCPANLTINNPAAFTLEGASSGAPTVLEPQSGSQTLPIISNTGGTALAFTLTGLELTGDQSSALELTGADPVTITHDVFSSDGNDGVDGGAISINGGSSSNTPTTITANTFSSDLADEGGAVSYETGRPLVLSGNTFTGNFAAESGGAVIITASGNSNPTRVSDNVFGGPTIADGNTTEGQGGAIFVAGNGQPITIAGNSFENNRVTGAGASSSREGAALWLGLLDESQPYTVTQSHNAFTDNAIDEPAASGQTGLSANGGAEWIVGLTVDSTADVFSGNRIAVNDGAPPEGGAVGAIAARAVGPTPAQAATFVGRDDLFSGNSVAAGGWGGAIYVGGPDEDCTPIATCPGSTLTIEDSTVVGNSVATASDSEGGAIWGSPNDHLTVENSIVYGNTPRPEIWGFGPGKTSFGYSDACNEAGGATVSGPGMICASPALSAGGVETSTSPTIDAGSNALVPAGLTNDLAGNARILASRYTCAGPGPAVVDLGAFESTLKLRPPCPLLAPFRLISKKLADLKGATGVKLRCVHATGKCKGTVSIKTQGSFRTRKHGRRHHLSLGSAKFKLSVGKTGSIRVRLSSGALKALGKRSSIRVVVTASGGGFTIAMPLTLKLAKPEPATHGH